MLAHCVFEQHRLRNEPQVSLLGFEAEQRRNVIVLVTNLLKREPSTNPKRAELHFDLHSVEDSVVSRIDRSPNGNSLVQCPGLDELLADRSYSTRGLGFDPAKRTGFPRVRTAGRVSGLNLCAELGEDCKIDFLFGRYGWGIR